MTKCSHGPENDKQSYCTKKEQMMEERRCENCWYCQEWDTFSYFKDEKIEEKSHTCRFNAPINSVEIHVNKNQWCGKFYPKDLPPPWKLLLIHKQG
jgi:hypothetical protein